MKSKYSVIIVVSIALLTGLFASCGKDRWELYYPMTRQSIWIDSVMRENYLWNDELSDEDELTSSYFLNSVSFLAKVKNTNDKMSYVDTACSVPRYQPGFDLSLYPINDSIYMALVTHVEPASSSAAVGIKRGDWIVEIDGKELTETIVDQLGNGEAHTLAIGSFVTIPATEDEEEQYGIMFDREVELPVPSGYFIEALPAVNVVGIEGGQVGYMLYSDISAEHREKVAVASKSLASSGITDMVLDLRFAATGDVQGLQYLASILAPAQVLGTKMATVKYAESRHADTSLPFLPASELASGENLNLETLYVLTSSETAGPAEMLINCLKTVMNVVVIGQKTEGSVAQACESFHDLNRDQLLRLVVCELTDANGESSYTGSGFTPDYSAEPFNPIEGIQPYGSPSENLFAKALSVIAGEEEATEEEQ